MKGSIVRKGIIAILIFFIAYMLYDAIMQPGTGDLQGKFNQVALYRNENNTGPVMRIYVVTLEDTLWQEMKDYGNLMPHTKYGTTKVYFFLKDTPVPDTVFPGKDNFDARFKPYCLAVYEKNAMSSVSLRRNPF